LQLLNLAIVQGGWLSLIGVDKKAPTGEVWRSEGLRLELEAHTL